MPRGRQRGVAVGPQPRTRRIIEAVNSLLDPDDPTTLRFIFYKLVSAGTEGFENNPRYYAKLINCIRDARVRGDVDDAALIDNRRTIHQTNVWSDPNEFLQTVKEWYSHDLWADQPLHVLIFVEKDTVAQVLRRVTDKYQVPLVASTGYFSRPILWQTARLIDRVNKPIRIGYVGDYDACGLDIERAAIWGNGETGTKCREGILALVQNYELCENLAERVTRVALTFEDFLGLKDYQRVPVKQEHIDDEGGLKKGDTRAKAYIERHATYFDGSEPYGGEVEALDADAVRDRVEEFILAQLDTTTWGASLAAEARNKADLERLHLEGSDGNG